MKRIKLLRAKTGTYKDRETGEEKMGYTTIGSLLEGDKGKMLKIDSIPVNFDGWVYFGDIPSDRMNQAPQQKAHEGQPKAQPAQSFDDDIPF